MAYAVMIGLPPVHGLYVSFFNILVYMLLGTSRHLSTGTYAIVSLILANSVRSYEGLLYPGASDSQNSSSYPKTSQNNKGMPADTSEYISENREQAIIMLAAMIAFTVGVIHLCFALLHIGFMTKYLSDSIVGGFTCASALHVIISQIGTLLGLNLKEANSPFVLAEVKKKKKTRFASRVFALSLIFINNLRNEINKVGFTKSNLMFS
jgi:MFS superfamily sulfate permease-like transporter